MAYAQPPVTGAERAPDAGRPSLSVEKLAKVYEHGGEPLEVIRDVSFDVAAGEMVCIIGPSGCGKTTLLRCMSGLLEPTAGRAVIDGSPVRGPRREAALVFQDYSRSLLPWLSVSGNVELPLRDLGWNKAKRAQAVGDAIEAVGLTRFRGHHPWQLSGGMQQRVALARALAYRPDIFFMDEPFASLDAQTRSELEDQLLGLQAQFGATIVFVTHDIDEAIYLADRVIVLGTRPMVIDKVYDVRLAKPRSQIETKALPEFITLRSALYADMKRLTSGAREKSA